MGENSTLKRKRSMFLRIDRAVVAGCLAICLMTGSLFGQAPANGTLPRAAGGSVRVLIITGGGDHDWRAMAPFLRRILNDTGRFDVRICESPAGLSERTLADFDVVVDDFAGPSLGADTENTIARFVESGKGLVATHGALSGCPARQSPAGETQPARAAPGYWPAQPSSGTHTPALFLEVTNVRTDHPVVQGMKSGFRIADAIDRGLTVRPGAQVLATARVDGTTGGGQDQPILVACSHGKGRVVATALGHDLAAMQEPEFITTFARSTEWAATGAVTLPAELGLPRPSADAVKALLITGGHDHETAFYTLFDGYKDLAWVPVAASTTAFQNDLRGKYDVVVMYDFSRDLAETGKKNLRDFVESGKGVVVLHHALLNYQKWPWWIEQVVGGSYRLAPEGNNPSSTVKDGQQMFVTPAGQHPITANIGPFHIVDESYKRMWMSPRIQPILTTDNPNSDQILAWVSPFAQSRIVAIQLGHGHTAFGHPSYRALVHNAILWAAGRIK
jgi:type 1 glutamine amidotransferase